MGELTLTIKTSFTFLFIHLNNSNVLDMIYFIFIEIFSCDDCIQIQAQKAPITTTN